MAPYTVTEGDALWLARAVEAEGPVQSQVAAALINGFCFARSRGYTKPLTAFVRAYAQPVNPRWYATGDLFLAWLEGKSDSEKIEGRKTAERREHVHSARAVFSPGTQAAVTAALNGRALIPASATDYAAAYVDASGKGYKPVSEPKAGQNRLWSRPGADKWTGYVIDATDAWPWLVTLAVVGVLAWKGIA
jgi:hypothetical protein